MKLQKFLIFAISVLGISIVIFNNLNQIVKEIFIPQLNIGLWLSFAVITLVVITYVVVNKNLIK